MAWRWRCNGELIRSRLLGGAAKLLPASAITRLHQLNRKYFEHDWIGPGALLYAPGADSASDTAIRSIGLDRIWNIGTLCIVMTMASNLRTRMHWEDRNSMARSVAARVPLLDHPLVYISLSLGREQKIEGTNQIYSQAIDAGYIAADGPRSPRQAGFCNPGTAIVSWTIAAPSVGWRGNDVSELP